MRHQLNSWMNYRKLGGEWHSTESTIKVLPFAGVILIRSNTDPNFIKIGTYSFDANNFYANEISVEETTFYQEVV